MKRREFNALIALGAMGLALSGCASDQNKIKFKGEKMTKVAVIGANGKSGSNIVREALAQGYDVTAIVRNKAYKNDAVKVIYKDIFELNKADLAEFDVVISGFAAWTPETFPLHKKVATHLSDLLSGSQTRLFIVGGAGTLYVDEALKTRVMDTPEFPPSYMGVAKATADSLAVVKSRPDVKWTYVSPAGEYDAKGRRSGKYELGSDVIKVNSKGESYISYADLAIAIVDEIKNQKFIQKRFTAVSER